MGTAEAACCAVADYRVMKLPAATATVYRLKQRRDAHEARTPAIDSASVSASFYELTREPIHTAARVVVSSGGGIGSFLHPDSLGSVPAGSVASKVGFLEVECENARGRSPGQDRIELLRVVTLGQHPDCLT